MNLSTYSFVFTFAFAETIEYIHIYLIRLFFFIDSAGPNIETVITFWFYVQD